MRLLDDHRDQRRHVEGAGDFVIAEVRVHNDPAIETHLFEQGRPQTLRQGPLDLPGAALGVDRLADIVRRGVHVNEDEMLESFRRENQKLTLASLEVESLPMSMPAAFHLDVSGLDDFEKGVYLRDLTLDANVTAVTDLDEMIARVAPPRVEEEPAVAEELEELDTVESRLERERELGDLLFSIVNAARWLGVDAEWALRQSNARFFLRFATMERLSRERGQSFSDLDLSLDEKESLWQQAKTLEG